MITSETQRREKREQSSSASLCLCGFFSWSLLTALLLLALFIAWNARRASPDKENEASQGPVAEREHLPDTAGWTCRRLAFHDFESGNPADTSSRLAGMGHNSRQSLRLKPWAPFSPGLWIRFSDLKPADTAWIRASGWVYFTGKEGAKAYLVVTCNHNGLNYKYMYIDLEKEKLIPGQWNRVSIDYRIPRAPHLSDVLQAYFWYRGSGELQVDDVGIEFYVKQ
ncbi:MAG TPA: hypothetical protein PKG48_11815 [Bacteroidales bacterium]|nr:hypothetical protein [Bacteroidales bacterium]HPS63181.1 hypothetical protein [Bacteroidales bacterium]